MGNKKLLTLIGGVCLALVLAVLPFMTACPAPAEEEELPPAEEEEEAPPPKFIWKLGTPCATGHISFLAQEKFAELLYERTNGQIEVKLYPSEALGTMYDEFENVVRGTQEMGFLPPSPYYNKALQVVYMPYLVTDWQDGMEVYSPGGWMYELLKPKYADLGVELLGFSFLGFDGYGSTKGPVIKPSDITDLGLKSRVWCTADRLLFDSLGGTVSMPFCDLYTALETGLCHAQDNAPNATYDQLRDVTEYYTYIKWMFEVFPVMINKELYDSLTPELRTAVDECMAEALTEYNEKAMEADEEYMQKMEDYGIQVTRLTPEQLEPWIEAGRAIWPGLEEECGADIVAYCREHAK